MSNSTQAHNLYNLLVAAGATGVTRADIATHLGVSEGSVPVYIFGLKKFFSAEIDNIKDGRKVVAYKLTNASDIEVPSHRLYRRNDNGAVILSNPSAGVTKPVKATKTKVTKVAKKKAAKVVNVTKPKSKKIIIDDGDVAILDKDLEISEFTDAELNDIRSTLGL